MTKTIIIILSPVLFILGLALGFVIGVLNFALSMLPLGVVLGVLYLFYTLGRYTYIWTH